MSPVVTSLSDFLSHTARLLVRSVTPRSTLQTSHLPLIDEATGGGFPTQATTELFTNQMGYGEIKLLLPTLAEDLTMSRGFSIPRTTLNPMDLRYRTLG